MITVARDIVSRSSGLSEMKLDFWFEFGSTYSYPAALRIERLAQARGMSVSWRPFLLGAIFRAQGWYDSPFNLYPAKGRYMWRDLARICESDGIPFRRPSEFPRNGLLAARVACRFSGASWLPGFVRAVYRANFGDDLDIADPAILASCLASVGVDSAKSIRDAQSEEAKLALRHQTDEAVRLGVFGAPSFVVDGELFWGNDRLEDALAWAAKRATDH